MCGRQIRPVTTAPTPDVRGKQTRQGCAQSHPAECSTWIMCLCFPKEGTKAVKKQFLETHWHLPRHINALEKVKTELPVQFSHRQQNNDVTRRLQSPPLRAAETHIFFFFLFKMYLPSNFPVSWVCYKKALKFGFRLKSQTWLIIYSRLPLEPIFTNEFKI